MNDTVAGQINELVSELDAIADKNHDSFCYRIDIDPTGFDFICEETADGHTFVAGSGKTIADAIKDARASIPDALEEWAYEKP